MPDRLSRPLHRFCRRIPGLPLTKLTVSEKVDNFHPADDRRPGCEKQRRPAVARLVCVVHLGCLLLPDRDIFSSKVDRFVPHAQHVNLRIDGQRNLGVTVVTVCTAQTFRVRTAKVAPPSLDLFGWCTWDAFYSKVDGAGILGQILSHRMYLLVSFRASTPPQEHQLTVYYC